MYSVTVKIEAIEGRRRSAGLLHIVNGFFLVAKAADYFKYAEYTNFFAVVPTLLIGTLSLFYGFFRKRVDPFAHYNYGMRIIQVVAFAALVVMFIAIDRPADYIGISIFVVLSSILVFSEKKIFEETTIFFDENGIRIPGGYRDHMVPWSEVSNVVVREDFVTIFHVKQKYLQYQVIQDLSTLETAKMNAFCKEKIESVNRESSIVNGRG